ncbi:hypothetical protein [Zhongshania arctica]|uniref:BON domain-containing protein n=1 Tax=Zhongshania arctica TaxID=3238302 RepID=A0ABV3U040_9GAMM
MKIKQIITASAIGVFACNLAFASPTSSSNPLYVQAGGHIGVHSSADQELAKAVISKLQADSKLAGVLEVDSRDGNISISGRVDEVSMIYRVVEIIKDNNAVKSVDVRQLDT